MICVASSKHRSMRLARIWNSRSPGVETAWRAPARISRNGCSSAGRGAPNSRSHASEPNPMTQERPASRSRNSTARNRPARSPQNERTVARLSGPGLIVTTRKIAARVSGAATGCATARTSPAASGAVIGSDSIDGSPWRERAICTLKTAPDSRAQVGGKITIACRRTSMPPAQPDRALAMDDGLVCRQLRPVRRPADRLIFARHREASQAVRERPLHAPREEVFFAGYDPGKGRRQGRTSRACCSEG